MGKSKEGPFDGNGKTVGTYSDNPIIIYEVECPDGELREHAANIQAEKC
jgi:hypothetical protein